MTFDRYNKNVSKRRGKINKYGICKKNYVYIVNSGTPTKSAND